MALSELSLTQNQKPSWFEPMSAWVCSVDLITRRKSLGRSIAIWPLRPNWRPSVVTWIEGAALRDRMVAAFLLCWAMNRVFEMVSLAIGGGSFRASPPEVPALQPAP